MKDSSRTAINAFSTVLLAFGLYLMFGTNHGISLGLGIGWATSSIVNLIFNNLKVK